MTSPMTRTTLLALALALLIAADPAWSQTIRYYHTDITGSVVAVTDEQGNVVERRQYEPYGRPQSAIPDGPGYTGHDMDGETGLIYMQQRYYDPMVGRFISQDPMAVDPITAWNFNRYNYAANNPYRYTDPDGRSIYTKAIKLVINGGDIAATTAGIVSDFDTLTDTSASLGDRTFAAVSLLSELAPVSIGDLKDAGKGIAKVVESGLKDGDRLSTDQALDAASDFLGTNQRHVAPGVTRSADGTRQVRMTDADLSGAHAGGPHMNFESGRTVRKPNGGERFEVDENMHIYLREDH